jgi:antitoxin VapB
MKTAKIFQHGNSQAVRLPKEFRFEDREVAVKRHGSGLLLLPLRYTFDDLMSVLQEFQGPIDRGDDKPPQRRKF